MKENKGITLVALIITIIVLLILAVVTISAVNEGSLFSHANNAATKYKEGAEAEDSTIQRLLGKLGQDSNAVAEQGDYTYTIENGEVTITGLSPDGKAKITNGTTQFSIPSEITDNDNAYPVTTIGQGAFLNCTNIEAVISNPEEVQPIYKTEDYDKITKIILPDSITVISDYAFVLSKANINLPSNLTEIGEASFAGCSNLSISQLPSAIETIENNAFYRATGITITTFPNSITSIGDYAFAYCGSAFGDVTIPYSLSSAHIGDNIFNGTVLNSLTVDVTGTGLSKSAFEGTQTNNIIIGEHVQTLIDNVFKDVNSVNGNSGEMTTVTFLGRPNQIDHSSFADMYSVTFIVPWTQANKFNNEPWQAGKKDGNVVRFHYSDMAEGTYYYYHGE